ncbi:MAG: AAA family ATPase, partial [Deltaproteobacteria bacterium]|nr:AAA family ATPase [Deltaproteobacteria bacterium]
MKLVKLSVKRFQCIEAAELEFGPGLNVLYGPNDLGKSSLAWAIRAVLLLQHGSSEHAKFVSWYGGGEPRVELTLTDDEGRYWRVSKTFGAGTAGRSSLETSKDGRTFNADVSGRQVDEKLRKMLGWGLAGLGGQGAAKGLPDSFLAQVLLAEQDNVRTVLFDTSLTDDPDESGRLRLTQALGALAQDPLFKDVLDDAQGFVDRAFTPTGRKKRSAGSPFVELGDQIKELRHERAELEAKLRETGVAEDRIRELIERRDAMGRELDRGRIDLTDARHRLEVSRQHAALRAQLETHLATLRSVTALEVRIVDAGRERDELGTEVEAGGEIVRDAAAALQQCEQQRDTTAAQLDALVHADVVGEQE